MGKVRKLKNDNELLKNLEDHLNPDKAKKEIYEANKDSDAIYKYMN